MNTDLYRNPTEAQVNRFTKGNAAMRVLLERSTGDFLVWPANNGQHADMMVALKLTDETADNMGSIKSYADLKKLMDWVAKG